MVADHVTHASEVFRDDGSRQEAQNLGKQELLEEKSDCRQVKKDRVYASERHVSSEG